MWSRRPPTRSARAASIRRAVRSRASASRSYRCSSYPPRNLVLIQGSGADRITAAETVLSFDGDWMRCQSVGIYPIRNSAPDAIIAELERIMDTGEGGLSQTLVKLQPISRLNAIMVVTSKPNLLRAAGTWISRLD